MKSILLHWHCNVTILFLLLNIFLFGGCMVNETICLQQWDCKWRTDFPYTRTEGQCSYLLPGYYPIDGPSSSAPEGSRCNLNVDCKRGDVNSTEMFKCIHLLTSQSLVESLRLYRCNDLELKNGDLEFLTSMIEFNISYAVIKEMQDEVFYKTTNLVTVDVYQDYEAGVSISEYPRAFIGPVPQSTSEISNTFLPNLRHLILSSFNFSTGIPENAFQHLGALQTIEFEFVTLQNSDFQSMQNLTELAHLKIYDSQNIDSLPPRISTFMPNLQHFEISMTNISNITVQQLESFHKLETLILDDNLLVDIDLLAFQHLTNLRSLSLAGNQQLQIIPFFDRLTQLEKLVLSNCAVSNLSLEVFTNLDNLKHLSLKKNKLKQIPPLFTNFQSTGTITLKNVEIVDLSDNEISSIMAYTFSNLENLKSIDLYKNYITVVHYRTFFNLKSLEKVSLEFNAIRNIHREAFDGISTLKNLNLEGNMLKNFPKLSNVNWEVDLYHKLPRDPFSTDIRSNPLQCNCDMFRDVFTRVGRDIWQLQYYYDIIWPGNYFLTNQLFVQAKFLECQTELYGKNKIDLMLHDPERWFSYVSSIDLCPHPCRCLSQCSNGHFYAVCRHANLTSIPNGLGSWVNTLYLEGNMITQLDSTSLSNMPDLTNVDLGDNRISSIEDGTFHNLHSLREVSLRGNNLTVIHSSTFNISSSQLKYLDISSNNIADIDRDSFLSVSSLEVLKLDQNKLETISQGVFDNLHNLSLLTISDNPFNCTCDLLYLTDWYVKVAFVPERSFSSDIAEIGCAPFLNETELYDWMQEQTVTCNPVIPPSDRPKPSSVIVVLVGVCAAAITSLVLGFIYKFRLEILVLIYTKTGVKIFDRNDSNGEEEKTFDAFISFSSMDRQFVLEEFIPRLESEENKRKLCIHHRDFVVGECIATNIINAIENSNKILILCSKNYLESEWCSYEFKKSHHQALSDRSRRIVLIMMEDVNKSTLDKEIKAYISTNTYLEKKDPLFWSKLLYSVPAAKRGNIDTLKETNANNVSSETCV
ncbi:uncharacterized protein [Apostichopus japonicus]|uniref:uncharacterized protein n=1 Tax=Stichopus japonicus TaxID=307972 RepID=UPI003AB7E9E3